MALQTKTFTVGSIDSGEYNYYALDLILTEESTSTTGNSSKISYTLQLRSGYNSFSLFGLGASISLDGTVIATRDRYSQPQMSMDTKSTLIILSGNTTVAHDSDGGKIMNVAFSIDMATSSVTPGPISVTGKTMTLTAIPRASTVGASDANIGAKSTIVVTRKSTAYTHSIAYKFGSLSGYVTADGGVSATEVMFATTSVSWTVPTTFYDQIPNAKSGTCTLTIKTYSGSTQIGDAQTDTFTVTAAQSACAPSVSGSVVDSNEVTKALTGDATKFVRYYSTAFCTTTATAKNGASITQKKIGGTVVSGSTRSIAEVEVDSIAFYAQDSRGYEASADVNIELIPYVILTNNPSCQRTGSTSGNAILSIKGNYFNGSFGAADNTLTIKYRIGTGEYTDMAPAINGNTYTATAELSGLDYEQSYEVEVAVEDKLSLVTKTIPINRGTPVYDWGKDDFRINVALRLLGAAYGTSLPATGKEGQVFFLLSNGSYTVRIHDGTSWT